MEGRRGAGDPSTTEGDPQADRFLPRLLAEAPAVLTANVVLEHEFFADEGVRATAGSPFDAFAKRTC